MRSRFRLFLSLMGGLAAALPAFVSAGVLTFAYSYTGNGIAGAGLLTTTDTLVAGAYTVTGIQGLRNGNSALSLYSPGAFLGNDNLLFPSHPFVDFSGISYAAGGAGFNLYNNSICGTDQDFELAVGSGCGAGNLISLSVTPFTPNAGDSYFAYTYTGSGIAAAGILTAGPLVGGAHTVTGIQGLRNGNSALSLYSPGAFLGNDNLLFPSHPFVDFSGISYAAGGAGFNLYNNSICGTDQDFELAVGSGCGAGNLISLSVIPLRTTAVPEPATVVLLLVGIAVIGFRHRRNLVDGSNTAS